MVNLIVGAIIGMLIMSICAMSGQTAKCERCPRCMECGWGKLGRKLAETHLADDACDLGEEHNLDA
jgi:hypothetical protein